MNNTFLARLYWDYESRSQRVQDDDVVWTVVVEDGPYCLLTRKTSSGGFQSAIFENEGDDFGTVTLQEEEDLYSLIQGRVYTEYVVIGGKWCEVVPA